MSLIKKTLNDIADILGSEYRDPVDNIPGALNNIGSGVMRLTDGVNALYKFTAYGYPNKSEYADPGQLSVYLGQVIGSEEDLNEDTIREAINYNKTPIMFLQLYSDDTQNKLLGIIPLYYCGEKTFGDTSFLLFSTVLCDDLEVSEYPMPIRLVSNIVTYRVGVSGEYTIAAYKNVMTFVPKEEN